MRTIGGEAGSLTLVNRTSTQPGVGDWYRLVAPQSFDSCGKPHWEFDLDEGVAVALAAPSAVPWHLLPQSEVALDGTPVGLPSGGNVTARTLESGRLEVVVAPDAGTSWTLQYLVGDALPVSFHKSDEPDSRGWQRTSVNVPATELPAPQCLTPLLDATWGREGPASPLPWYLQSAGLVQEAAANPATPAAGQFVASNPEWYIQDARGIVSASPANGTLARIILRVMAEGVTEMLLLSCYTNPMVRICDSAETAPVSDPPASAIGGKHAWPGNGFAHIESSLGGCISGGSWNGTRDAMAATLTGCATDHVAPGVAVDLARGEYTHVALTDLRAFLFG